MASITRINIKTAPKVAEAKKEAAATPDEMALAAAGEASEAVHAACAGQAASVEEAAVAATAQAAESEAVSTATNGAPAEDDTPATIEAPVAAEPTVPGDAPASPLAEKVDTKPVDDRLWRAVVVGDVVLMADYSEGEFQGWRPAKVITLVEGRASCVFVDYEEMGHFSRQITELALLHPMHAD